MSSLLLLALAALLLLAGPDYSGAGEPDWSQAEEGVIAEVLSGDRLLLEDGRELRLAGVRLPRPPLGYHDEEPWRREEIARKALEARLPPGTSLAFLRQSPAHDRHRRLLVQAAGPGGWLQEELLARGILFLDRWKEEPPARLLAAERAAREAGRGLWSDPLHRVLPADLAEEAIGRFAVIEGRVLAAAQVRNLGYLNFDEDWREDFTVRFPRNVLRELERQERSLEDFAGRRIRIRGWLFYSGGAMIEIERLAEIEDLGD